MFITITVLVLMMVVVVTMVPVGRSMPASLPHGLLLSARWE